MALLHFLSAESLSVSGITQTCRLRVMEVRYGAGIQTTAGLMTLGRALTSSWLYSEMSRPQQDQGLQCQTDLVRLYSPVFVAHLCSVDSFRLTMVTSQSMVASSRFLDAALLLELQVGITILGIRGFACLAAQSGLFLAL